MNLNKFLDNGSTSFSQHYNSLMILVIYYWYWAPYSYYRYV